MRAGTGRIHETNNWKLLKSGNTACTSPRQVTFIYLSINANMANMTSRQIIALAAGGITTVIAFVAAMLLLIFGGYYSGNELLVFVSIALAPVLMVAVMIGYAVWWLVMFLLSLFLPDLRGGDGQ